jgi:hypothetical protein
LSYFVRSGKSKTGGVGIETVFLPDDSKVIFKAVLTKSPSQKVFKSSGFMQVEHQFFHACESQNCAVNAAKIAVDNLSLSVQNL